MTSGARRLLGWSAAVGAALTPVAVRLATAGELDVAIVRGSAVAAFAALLLARWDGRGLLRAFWPAVAGAVAAAYLPILLLGWALLPGPGSYRSQGARPGLAELGLDARGALAVFRPGAGRGAHRLERSWDGTLGSHDRPLDGSAVVCFDDCPPWFTLSRRWPGSDELVLVERFPEVRVARYVRVHPSDPP